MLEFIDLFCGGGFGARGAVYGGGRPLLAVDAWNLATETYKANFPEATVIQERIENIDPFQFKNRFFPDVLLTSPECTSHSIARGAKPGNEKSRETAISIFPWIDAFNPRWVIVENVSRIKQWERHNELISTLENYGYMVNQLLLNSADFGTPQSRKRLFLICDRQGEIITKETLLKLYQKPQKNAKSIIDWSDQYKSSPLYKPGRAKSTIERAERAIESLGKNVPFLIVYYGSDYAGGWQTLDAPLRTITTIDRFGLVTWENEEAMLRMLQPPELLNAMGAGKRHQLPAGNRRDKVKLCGNGVCSPVMEAVFKEINRIMQTKSNLAIAV
ncbi:MAG: DNA (cytosine-5-)-methyltransferase [Methylobacter sp.]|nr:MAG: DNA (cytosine-5-)-methyltransferase [Methylobacter sp.]